MFSYTIPQLLQIVAKSYTWKVKTKDKKLYLTFDDGPHPNITMWVMAQLAEYNAKATFFCVGENVKKYPETYKEILKMKHAVGNHTYHHLNGWNTPVDAYLEDIQKAAKLIHSPLFRPPYGRILPSQTKRVLSDYQLIMWNYLSGDFVENLNREKSLRILKRAEPGSIMVFHDSEKAFENLKYLLPKILEYFNEQGYTFEAIPYK